MNEIGYFEVQADDLQRAMKFYETTLGWEFAPVEYVPIEYYRISNCGVEGGLLKRPVAPPPAMCGTNAYCCSIQVEDFDRTAAAILAAGGQVALEKFALPGRCWQGYFLDTEGNVFGIFQFDRNAK